MGSPKYSAEKSLNRKVETMEVIKMKINNPRNKTKEALIARLTPLINSSICGKKRKNRKNLKARVTRKINKKSKSTNVVPVIQINKDGIAKRTKVKSNLFQLERKKDFVPNCLSLIIISITKTRVIMLSK